MSDGGSVAYITTTRAYGVALRDEQILLVRASSSSNVPGVWWLPGGGIDFGEAPVEALQREVLEETGLSMTAARLVDVMSDVRTRRNGDVVHTVRVIYRIEVTNGELRHETNGTTDLAHWFDVADLENHELTDYARRAIALAIQTK